MRSGRLLKVPGCGTVRLHHLTAITLVAGTIFAREGCAPPAVKVWQERPCSHLPGASNYVTKHACTHCPAAEALMSLCFVHLLSPRVAPLSCCDGHGMCMLYHGSCGHFHFGAAAALFGTYRMALDRDRKRCVACHMGIDMCTSVVTPAVADGGPKQEKVDSRLLPDLRNG